MEVVEFSLTDTTREALKTALDDYMRRGKNDEKKLGEIISENLPEGVIKELKKFARNKSKNSTIYVIRKLPMNKLPKRIGREKENEEDIGTWAKSCYMANIARGISVALELTRQRDLEDEFVIPRFRHFQDITGDTLHKHGEEITMLGGIVSDGAKTRFTDMGTMLEQVKEDKDYQKLDVQWRSSNVEEIKLGALETCLSESQWPKPKEMVVIPIKRSVPAFHDLEEKHSQDVKIDSGALAIWANDGRIMHRAMPADKGVLDKGDKDALIRLVVGLARNRPITR